jgi:hypothetical protein
MASVIGLCVILTCWVMPDCADCDITGTAAGLFLPSTAALMPAYAPIGDITAGIALSRGADCVLGAQQPD